MNIGDKFNIQYDIGNMNINMNIKYSNMNINICILLVYYGSSIMYREIRTDGV